MPCYASRPPVSWYKHPLLSYAPFFFFRSRSSPLCYTLSAAHVQKSTHFLTVIAIPHCAYTGHKAVDRLAQTRARVHTLVGQASGEIIIQLQNEDQTCRNTFFSLFLWLAVFLAAALRLLLCLWILSYTLISLFSFIISTSSLQLLTRCRR